MTSVKMQVLGLAKALPITLHLVKPRLDLNVIDVKFVKIHSS